MTTCTADAIKHSQIIAESFSLCKHCGQANLQRPADSFCCSGCKIAYEMISELGLESFYKNIDLDIRPVDELQANQMAFDYFDQKQILDKIGNSAGHRLVEVELKISGLTCFACAWLIEQALHRLYPDVLIVLNLRRSTASITFNPSRHKLSQIAANIYKLGFSVKILLQQQQSILDATLVQLGVATVCAMNIMLLALSDYFATDGGMTSDFVNLFRYLSLTLATVSLVFAGRPFFKNALNGIRSGKANIDQPVCLGILSAYLLSLINTLRGEGFVYFDSLTLIILLLLVGKSVQEYILDKSKNHAGHTPDLSMEYTRVRINGRWELTPIDSVMFKNELLINKGETIPVNAELQSPLANISLESLNGEALPFVARQTDKIPAGAICLDDQIRFSANQNGADSYLCQMQRMRSEISLTKTLRVQNDRYAAFFLIGLIAASVFAFLFNLQYSVEIACSRAIAGLLIACPCSIAFARPLVYAWIEKSALRSGIIFTRIGTLAELAKVKNICWDKTGTLTIGEAKVIDARLEMSVPELKDILFQLTKHSQHHAIQALSIWASNSQSTATKNKTSIRDFKEQSGYGIGFFIDEMEIKIGNRTHCNIAPGIHEWANVFVTLNQKLVASFLVKDSLKSEAKSVVNALKAKGFNQRILSGDHEQTVHEIGFQLGFSPVDMIANLSPNLKLNYLSNFQGPTAMIGNGFNDSLVLAAADVSFSVANAHSIASNIADIHIARNDLRCVTTAFDLAKKAQRRIIKIKTFAIFYNVAGLTAAFFGYLPPVTAAILMPISSISVILLAMKG